MRCPFLREVQVKSCQAFQYRKLVVRLPAQTEDERCSSARYRDCPVCRQHFEEHPAFSHCPFLQESLVQYCAAATIPTYVPYTESSLSTCGTESHKYCELFAALADPEGSSRDTGEGTRPSDGSPLLHHDLVEGIRVPSWLHYSANHMWLDISDDGMLHAGVDQFFTRLLGKIERMSFVTQKGRCYPTAVLTAGGVDTEVVFPNEMEVTRTNSYLRTDPSRLLNDPYARGWLFEGREVRPASPHGRKSVKDNLVTSAAAVTWMRAEMQKLRHHVDALSSRPTYDGTVLMADGGIVQEGLFQNLSREETLLLVAAFFPPRRL